MEEGPLAKWLVKVGGAIEYGDILAEIETGKTTMEFKAVAKGTIGQILFYQEHDCGWHNRFTTKSV